jgi:hypothetical protein
MEDQSGLQKIEEYECPQGDGQGIVNQFDGFWQQMGQRNRYQSSGGKGVHVV